MKHLLLALIALLVFTACKDEEKAPMEPVQIEVEAPAIKGVWEIVNMEWKTADTTEYDMPFRSIYIYTDNYYSIERIWEERASFPELQEGEERDPQVLADAYGPLNSNSGTYEIVGDSIISNAVIAKWPNYMNDDPRSATNFSIKNDTLYFHYNRENGTGTITFKRLE